MNGLPSQTSTCPICGTPITAGVLGGKCPTCLKKVALMEPPMMEDTQAVPPAAPTHASAAWVPPPFQTVAALLPAGAYSVEGFIGLGGMGAVYKGMQLRLRRPVAIKIMRQDQAGDDAFKDRFLREAHTLARLSHPGIVNVIDCGEAGTDMLYIVMEFVDGTDLMDVLRSGRMPQEVVLQLVPQICDALQFAHEHGVVHRDIKPSNILLTRDGRIKIADFGLAKALDSDSTLHTRSGVSMGTPDYAAPEQFTPGAAVDHRADIYALGVMIYQMITGQLPRGAWKAPSQGSTVDPQWDAIVNHAMQPRPQDRHASAGQVRTEVAKITTIVRATPQDSTAPKVRKRPRALLFSTAACLMLAAGGYLSWGKLRPAVQSTVAVPPTARASYPQPKAWMDATARVRDAVTKYGAGVSRGDHVQLTKPFFIPLSDERTHRDVVVRMRFTGLAGIAMRYTPGSFSYQCSLNVTRSTTQFGYDGETNTHVLFSQTSPPDLRIDLRAENELVMATEGDLLSTWLNGELVHSQRDSSLSSGRIALNLFVASRFPDFHPAIKKVEYGELVARTPIATRAALSGRDGAVRSSPTTADATTPAWQRPESTVSAGTEWTNLLPHIQPQRDAIRGEWSVDEHGLMAKPAPWATCNIPVKDPGTDYELRCKVTRGEGAHQALFFFFRKGDTGGFAAVDYSDPRLPEFSNGMRLAGLESVQKTMFRSASGWKKAWLPRGKECMVLLQVREQEVRLTVDDEEAFRWQADWTQIRQRPSEGHPMFKGMSGEPIFGVGIFNCEAVFHSIEMRQLGAPAAVAQD